MTITLHHGDCLDVLKNLRTNSVDAIVTDPPYGLSDHDADDVTKCLTAWVNGQEYVHSRGGFMNRTWDSWVPGPEVWREAIRVIKPGGYLLAFAGTRTMDLMSIAIRLGGFELQERISSDPETPSGAALLAWVYGCLDDKSEALTRRGWIKGVDLEETDDVMQWDPSTGTMTWVRPSELIRHHHSGPMIRFKNRHTDQMLTPDHRVHAKIRRHSRNPNAESYEVVRADGVKRHWQVSFPMAGKLVGSGGPSAQYAYLLGWWMTDAWNHGDGKAVMFSQSKPKTLAKLKEALAPYCPSEYVRDPRGEGQNAEHVFYVTGGIALKLKADCPDRKLTWDVLNWSETSRQALLQGLMDGDGSRKDGQYSDAFWSIDSERRDIFLALALSLGYRAYDDPENGCVNFNTQTDTTQIQSRHYTAPEQYDGLVWCVRVPTGAFVARRNGRPFITGNSGFPKSMDVEKALQKAGHPDEVSQKWRGHGTALKPGWEPIIVARKPLSAKMEWNVRLPEWGTTEDREGRLLREISAQTVERDIEKMTSVTIFEDALPSGMSVQDVEDKVLSMFNFGEAPPPKKEPVMASGAVVMDRPSRFFYCGKAGPADRDGSKHPTVKPVALMRYLVKLVTPPGGVVMDPFAGSGTTGAAAIDNNVDAILIEREDQYAEDIRNRFVLHMKE